MRHIARRVTGTIAGTVVVLAAAAHAGDDVAVLRGPLAADDGVAINGVARAAGAKAVRVVIIRRDWTSPNGWSSSWCHGAQNELVVADGGRFRFEGLVPGTFDLGAFAEGFADRKLDGVGAFAGATDVELRLERAARVRITVALGFEEDLEETWVSVADDDGISHGGGRPKDGVVEVAGLAPGTYWIAAHHTGGDLYFMAEKVRAVARRVELRSGANDAALTVPEAADVRFVARSARRGEAVEGVLHCDAAPPWQVREPFRAAWERDDPPGRMRGMSSMGYGLAWNPPVDGLPVRGLSKGAWTLRAEALGFAPWERKVSLDDRARVEAELTPLPGRYVVLPEPSGNRRETALYADVRPEDGGPWAPLTHDDHRFDPTHAGEWLSTRAFLAPGRYVVSVHSPEGAPSREELTVTDDRTSVVLSSSPATEGRTVRGTTRTRGGAAASGFLVHLLVAEGDRWRALRAKTQVVSDGGFEFRGVPPGRCRVAFDEAGAFALGEFEVAGADVVREFVVPARPR